MTSTRRPGPGPARRPPMVLRRHLAQWLVLLGCLVAVAFLVGGAPVQRVAGAAGFALVGILAAALPPDLLRSYAARGVEVGAFGLTARLPALPTGTTAEEGGELEARDLVELRLQLEQKLTYLAKHVLGTPDAPAFLTLGSMVLDGQLAPEKAAVCAVVSSLRVPAQTDLPPGQSIDDWLVDAQRTVASLRADVLTETTFTFLSRALGDDRTPLFRVERPARITGAPRAMIVSATGSDGAGLVVIPVWSFPPTGARVRRRVALAATLGRPTLVVCPPRARLGSNDTEVRDDVVRLPGLVEEVSRRLGHRDPAADPEP